MYSINKYILKLFTYTPASSLGYEILEKIKIFLCIICTDILEFVASKFNLNLAFVQLFISSYSTKNKNLYCLHLCLITQTLHSAESKHTDMFIQICNKLAKKISSYQEKPNHKQTHIQMDIYL